ncbi:MAG: hypothetical protein ACI87O_002383, partial [Planctomycetota bacterium]
MQDGSIKPHQKKHRGRSSRVLPWERLGALAGWAVILLFIGTAFVESTGILSRMVQRRAQVALTRLGLTAELGDSRVGWLSRSLNLSDVRVLGSLAKEELEWTLRDVRLIMGFRISTGFFLERIETKGGRFHFSEEGLRRLRLDLEAHAPPNQSSNPGLHVQPHVLVEGLALRYFDGRRNWDQGSLWAENEPSNAGLSVMARWLLPKHKKEVGDTAQLGSPQQILAQVRTTVGAPLRIQLQAHDVDLGATNLAPLLSNWVPAWQRDPMQGSVSLEARLGVPLAAGNKTSAEIRLKIRDAYTPLTSPGPNQHRLQSLDLDLEGRYSGRHAQDWKLRKSWRGRAQALTRWNDVDLRLQSRFGVQARHDSLADIWLQTDSLAVSEAFSESLGNPKIVTNLRSMLAPRGTIALAIGLRLPADLTWLDEKVPHLPIGVQVDSRGDMSVAYVGPPNQKNNGQRDVGFPRRIDAAEGKVIFIAAPGLDLSQRTGIYDVRGTVSEGRAKIDGGVWSPLIDQEARDLRRVSSESPRLLASSRLAIRGYDLTFDDAMLEAFDGMAGVAGSQEVLTDFSPRNGEVDLVLDFWGHRGQFSPRSRLEIQTRALSGQWRRFPIPLKDVSASVILTTNDGTQSTGTGQVQYEVYGSSPVARTPLSVRGHSISTNSQSQRSWTQVSAPELNLRSSALKVALDAVDTELRSVFEQAHLTGWLDLNLQSVQVQAEDSIHTFAEARPRGEGLSALPGAFPIET